MAKKYLAFILAAMGLLQVFSFSDFVEAIETYDLVSGASAELVGVVFVLIELGAALLLLTDPKLGSALSLLAFVIWTLFGVQAFVRGLDVPNCGCFGKWFSQSLRWWVLLEDVYLVALSAYILKKTKNL